jgi:hypothetical protein
MPTHREGPLAADAIRSMLPACDVVIVNEGPIRGADTTAGEPTILPGDLYKDQRVIFHPWVARGNEPWVNEAAKRNHMLERTRRYGSPLWGLYVDADEVLIHPELIPSLVWAAERIVPGVVSIPLLVTEVDGSVGRIQRLFRLDQLEAHVLSMSQLKFKGIDTVTVFPTIHEWRPGEPVTPTNRQPLQGEPHLHHRSYLRPPVRGEHRLHRVEVADYVAQNREELARLGFTAEDGAAPLPETTPSGLIIARELKEGN